MCLSFHFAQSICVYFSHPSTSAQSPCAPSLFELDVNSASTRAFPLVALSESGEAEFFHPLRCLVTLRKSFPFFQLTWKFAFWFVLATSVAHRLWVFQLFVFQFLLLAIGLTEVFAPSLSKGLVTVFTDVVFDSKGIEWTNFCLTFGFQLFAQFILR